MRHGIWIIVYSIVMVVLSFLGSFGQNYITFPLGMFLVILASLIAIHWGVRSGYNTQESNNPLAHESKI